jgi:hypothetical protein
MRETPIGTVCASLAYLQFKNKLCYITLHYITLHYITLHYITLHYITLHYITVPVQHSIGILGKVYA